MRVSEHIKGRKVTFKSLGASRGRAGGRVRLSTTPLRAGTVAPRGPDHRLSCAAKQAGGDSIQRQNSSSLPFFPLAPRSVQDLPVVLKKWPIGIHLTTATRRVSNFIFVKSVVSRRWTMWPPMLAPERLGHQRPCQPLFERGKLVLQLRDRSPQLPCAVV